MEFSKYLKNLFQHQLVAVGFRCMTACSVNNMLSRCKYFYFINLTVIHVLILGVSLAAVLCYFYLFYHASQMGCIQTYWLIVSDRKTNQSAHPDGIDEICNWQIRPPCPKMISPTLGKNVFILGIRKSIILFTWLLYHIYLSPAL